MSNLSEEEKIKRFPVIAYTRCVGWINPIKNFNPGKLAEQKDRLLYNTKEALKHIGLCQE